MLDTTLFRHLWFEVTTSEIDHFTEVTTPCEVQGEMLSSVKLELLWVSKQTQRVYIGFGTHMPEVTSQIQKVIS